jgi:hypothetical protein
MAFYPKFETAEARRFTQLKYFICVYLRASADFDMSSRTFRMTG